MNWGLNPPTPPTIQSLEPDAKVNNEYYCEHFLRRGFLPVIQATCGRYNWTLRQDETLEIFSPSQKYSQLSSSGQRYLH